MTNDNDRYVTIRLSESAPCGHDNLLISIETKKINCHACLTEIDPTDISLDIDGFVQHCIKHINFD
jgi:hypothetical protein